MRTPEEDFYIVATSSHVDERTLVLKHGDTFAVFDLFGDIAWHGPRDGGIYHRDTRYVSRSTLSLAEARPVLLSSAVSRDNAFLTVDLTNPDIYSGEVVALPHGTLHLLRVKVLWQGVCHERVRVHNYGHLPVSMPMDFETSCDFADIFEVRGMSRPQRGRRYEPEAAEDSLQFEYDGLDSRGRRTRVVFDTPPHEIERGRMARFNLRLAPNETAVYEWDIHCELDPSQAKRSFIGFGQAAEKVSAFLQPTGTSCSGITTGRHLFDRWIERSLADLRMLRTETIHGSYEYAGIPWFSTVFGRDGIIAAMETLWYDPAIARGVLSYLAATQAEEDDPESDAQPGKIIHETRDGEMAARGEVPFRRYYGSVDATPLFVMLAGSYYERTGDDAFANTLWPHIERALTWMERYGDIDGDGFLEYARRAEGGLVHQGWKDSSDPVFHADGTLAEPPIALCEVQAYAYAARCAAATIARVTGHNERAEELLRQADELRVAFDRAFWCEELDMYALALDADKAQCKVRTSNAGHALFAGIALPERAKRIAESLTDERFFSGWGIRTVAADEARYNPMSYHNGSVWPHDNAMVAAGLARYGFKNLALKIVEGLYDSTAWFDVNRLPELFCGFTRRPNGGPTLYPVACSPQAWSAGAVLMLIQAMLGMEVRGTDSEVMLTDPVLPHYLRGLTIEGLHVANSVVDVQLVNHDGALSLHVPRRLGDVQVRVQSKAHLHE